MTGAPRLPQVLPSVLEFLGGGVLVAHNAPFDAGFLRAACERHGAAWPRPPVLCTARLARAVLSRDEAPSVKLAALAELFGTSTRPTHRALADARATVEVLHHLLERIGNLGVQSLEELLTLVRDASPHRPTERQRHKRHLAGSVPSAPGVYLFRGARDEVLYVGTSGDLRRRVRSYFTAGERRRRIRDMVAQAERVDTIVCAHALEAGVHELRLIAAHRPRYNRRSRNPNATWWVTATAEAFPRLSVVPTPRDGALGPFRSQHDAREAVDAVLDAVPLRPCTLRIPARGRARRAVRALRAAAAAPRRAPGTRTSTATPRPSRPGGGWSTARTTARCTPSPARSPRWRRRSGSRRPPRGRDRLAGLVAALGRAQRLTALAGLAEVVGARPDGSGGWELAVVRHGRLAAAGVAPPRACHRCRWSRRCAPAPTTVLPGAGPLRGARRRGGAAAAPLAHRRRHPPGRSATGRGRSPPPGPAAWAGGHPVGRRGARHAACGRCRADRRDPQAVAAARRSRPRGVVVITAIVLVHVAADRIPETAQAIADLDGVDEVYSCAGDVDLIAMVKVARARAAGGRDRRAAQQGRRGAQHRHPHRLPLVVAGGHRGDLRLGLDS